MFSFLALPSLLLSLVLCILDARAAAAVEPRGLGGYVASGIGAVVLPTKTSNLSTITSLPRTGTGAAYASNCNAALQAWSSSSFDWMYAEGMNVTSTFSSAFTETTQAQGSIKVTSTTTLCDGYARVIGHTSYSAGPTGVTTEAWTNTYTTLVPNYAYPTATPCSIQPDDCQSLSSSFDALVSQQGQVTIPPPLCNISTGPAPTYSTGPNNQTCDNCLILAHTARLMYWPVTIAPGNLCKHRGSTITPSPTGSAPNVFVTEGMTITSPSVAISFAQISRADGCGPTIGHTIIPVKPEQVTSVRGYRALFQHEQFNFADLNYHCVSTNSTNYTLADGVGNDCYQEVPAAAYFGGLNNAAVLNQYVFRTMSKWQSTIYNNYQPQILLPNTMTKAITSIWGTSCLVHPDGVWDPPIALTPQAAIELPSYGPGETTSDHPAQTTPPAPAYPYGPYSPAQVTAYPDEPGVSHGEHFTALPENKGGASGSGAGGESGGIQGPGNGPQSGSGGSDSVSGSESGSRSGSDGSNVGQWSSSSLQSGPSGSNVGQGSGSSSQSGSSGSNTDQGSGSDPQSGSDTSNAGQGSGSGSQSGSAGYNAGQGSGDGQQSESNGDGSGSTGGIAGPGNGPQATSAPNGNGNGNGNGGSASGGSGDNGGSNGGNEGGGNGGSNGGSGGGSNGGNNGGTGGAAGLHYVVNEATFSIISSGNGAMVLENPGTTVTVSRGGPAAKIASQVVSAAPSDAPSGGLVVGTGSAASTIIPSGSGDGEASGQSTTKVIVGTKTLTCSRLSNGAWVVPDSSTTATVSPGGSDMAVDTATLSAASTGLVRADGSGASNGGSSAQASRTSGGVQSGSTGRSQSATSAMQDSSTASRASTVMGGVMGICLAMIGILAM